MVQVSLAPRALVLLALSLLATRSAAQRADTTRYVVVTSDHRAGSYVEWRRGRLLHSTYEYNDRGRGPHLEATMRVSARDLPMQLTVVGHEYLKDTADEHFTLIGDSASWHNTLDGGAVPHAAHAFYVSATETPTSLHLLALAARAAGGRIAMLPGGTATLERGADLTFQVHGRSVHVTEYDIGGLSISPMPLWLTDGGERFALVSSWTSIVPTGWERAIPAMVKAQEATRDARFTRLARELAHRPTGPLVIRHARLFVAESALVRPHTTVVVTGNRITAVGDDDSVAAPADAPVIDAAGQTLLPGLWDMHVHIQPGEDGLLHIAGGVTSARDMGNDTTLVLDLQRKFAADSLIGPRLVLAGLIDGAGPFQVPAGVVADDSDAARRAVDWYADHGYEQIKIYSSMKPALVPAIIQEAHRRGLRVSGHVPAFMTAEEVVRLGFDEVQHVNFLMLNFIDSVRDTRGMARFTAVGADAASLDFDSPRVRNFVALFKARGTVIDPTIGTFEGMFTARPGQVDPSQATIADRMPPQVRRSFLGGGLPVTPQLDTRYRQSFDAMLHMVKVMADAGVPVLSGTDAFPVGFALHRELELHVQAGIPAPNVLQMATLGAARVMHHDRELGSVSVGKLADLVLVDGDPVTRISDIRRTALVVKDGIVYRPAELYGALGIGAAPLP